MNTDYFNNFIKKDIITENSNKNVWIYTRVSSKDQESNKSLENQKEYAEKYALENKLTIAEEFGYTYESAKGDFTRKEFTKLINKIRDSKERPYAVIIYIMSRFSRSGAKAIAIVTELRELGIHLIESNSGLTTETEDGEMSILKKLLKAREENTERLKVTLPGMKKFLEEGNYLGKPPRGYTLYGHRTNNENRHAKKQRIEINEDGKLLKKAWEWKAQGERDYMILGKLKELGLNIPKQSLSSMWINPTYCGVSTNSMLDKAIKGNWKPIVSESDFVKIQEIIKKGKSGYVVDKTNEDRPLTGHLMCSECGRPMTGYEVKKKKVHYYKCNKCKGATANANTTKRSINEGVHESYTNLLSQHKLPSTLIEPFKAQLKKSYSDLNTDNTDDNEVLNKRLEKLETKEKKLTDKLLDEVITDSVYKNMKSEIDNEKTEILVQLGKTKNKLSNLDNFIIKSIEISQNISNTWDSGDYDTKIKVQDLVFPQGIVFDTKKRQYLTKNKNLIFACIEDVAKETGGHKKRLKGNKSDESSLVAGTGLEPATYGL